MGTQSKLKAAATIIVATLVLTALAPLATADHLPDRIPVPDDANGDGVPDTVAAQISSEVCNRSTLRENLTIVSEATGGELGSCEGEGTTWAWFPPPARSSAILTIPDPHQQTDLSTRPVDNDGDGVPSGYVVTVKMLAISIDSTGAFTYAPADDATFTFDETNGGDPNDDPADPCAASDPLPRVTPISSIEPDASSGTVSVTLGASIVYLCEERAPPIPGLIVGPAFPQTIPRVLTGQHTIVDEDGDGVPSKFIFGSEDVTFTDGSGESQRSDAAPFEVAGPDANDDPEACGATTPIPSVTGLVREIVLNPNGSLTFNVGAIVTIGCDPHDLRQRDNTTALLPQTIPGVPGAEVWRVDEDGDGQPGKFIINTTDITVLGVGETNGAPGEPIVLDGVDPDGCDCDGSLAGWVFIRNTDEDADTDFAELTGADCTQNPECFTAFNDPSRTLSDPDGDGFDSNTEVAAGTNPDDRFSHPNRAPTILISQNVIAIDENEEITITATATDPDPRFANPADPVERARGPATDVPNVVCTGPKGAVLTSGDGAATIVWTPTYAQGLDDAYEFLCTATDHGMQDGGTAGAPRTASASGEITVVDVNDLPSVNITLPSFAISEQTTATLAFLAEDSGTAAVERENLTIELVSPPAWAKLNEARDGIDLTPVFDTVAHPATSLVATLRVRVSDGVTPAVEDTVVVTVNDVNRAPVTTLTGVPADRVVDATEDVQMAPVTISAVDADGDAVNLTAEVQPTGSTFSGGTLSWKPTFNDARLHPVTLRATDAFGRQVNENFSIDVADTNRAPTISVPSGLLTLAEDALTQSFVVTGSDPDGTSISIRLTSPTGADMPTWATWNDDTDTLTIDPTFASVLHPNPQVEKTFVFEATSAGQTASDSRTVVITNVNRAPNAPVGTPVATVSEAALFSVDLTGTDVDLDPVTLNLTSGPGTAVFSDLDTLVWTPSQDYVAHPALTRDATFTVRATDGFGLWTERTFTLTVTDVNRAPVFAALPTQTVAEGGALTFTPTATDADGDDVVIQSTGGVGTFAAGTLSYSPAHDVVVHPAVSAARFASFLATDGTGSAAVTVDITVNDVNRLPVANLVRGNFPATMIVGHTEGAHSASIAPTCAGSTDEDAEDVLSCEFAWGDGTPVETTGTAGTPSHVYGASAAGARMFNLSVRDTVLVADVAQLVGGVDVEPRAFNVYVGSDDNDLDGLTNEQELLGTRNTLYGNLPTLPDDSDTDNDVDKDGDEIIGASDPNNKRSTRADRDGDGIPNGQESLLFSRTGSSNFDPDNGDAPVPGGVPFHNGDVLLRPVTGETSTRAHFLVYYDQNANNARDANEPAIVDTDILYTLDVPNERVTVRTSAVSLFEDVVIERDGTTVLVTTPDGTQHRAPQDALELVVFVSCIDGVSAFASADSTDDVVCVDDRGTEVEVCTAGVKVAGFSIVQRNCEIFDLPFPHTLASNVPDGAPEVSEPNLDTGEPARVKIPMRSVTIHRPTADPEFMPAQPIDMPVGPGVKRVLCETTFTPSAEQSELGTICVGADITVFVNGNPTPITSREYRTVDGLPFPHTLESNVPSGAPEITQPNFATGTPAHLFIPMESVVINKPPMEPTRTPANPIDMDLTPSIRVVECPAAFTPAPADDEEALGVACVGADVLVNGAPTPIVRTFVPLGGLPFPAELPFDTPAARQTGFFDIDPADPNTGSKTKITVKMERVTLHKPPTKPSAVASDAEVHEVGPSILIDPCEEPGAFPQPDESVAFCFGADIVLEGSVTIPGKQEGSIDQFPMTLDESIAFLEPNPVRLGRNPNFATGDPGSIWVKKTKYTVHRPDQEPPVTDDGIREEEVFLPAVMVDQCATAGPDDDGQGIVFCVGAKITIGDQPIDAMEEGEIDFPFALPVPVADVSKGADMVTFVQGDTTTGTPSTITVQRCIVQFNQPGTEPAFTCAPAMPLTVSGPAVLIEGCTGDAVKQRTPDGGFDICLGADVFVEGEQVAEKFEKTVPGPFPLGPFRVVDLDAAEPVKVTPANTTSGELTRVVVQMEDVTIDSTGTPSGTPAEDVDQEIGVPVKIIPCANAIQPRAGDGGVNVCLGADVYVVDMDTAVVKKFEDEVTGPFPVAIPVDVIDLDAAKPIVFTPPNTVTGTPGRILIEMETVEINADGTTTGTPANDIDMPVTPSILIVPCAGDAVTPREDGGFDVCLGADVTVDGREVAKRVAEGISGPFPAGPFTIVDLAAEDPVKATAADTSTGTPASVHVALKTVTVNSDHTTTDGEADDIDESGPAIKILPCAATITPTPEGGSEICVGADVYVIDMVEPVAKQFKTPAPGVFPVPIPVAVIDLDAAKPIDFTPPNTLTGAPARIVIQMETVEVNADGSTTDTEADDFVIRGPVVKIDLRDVDDAPTTDVNRADAAIVSVYADLNDDGIKQEDEPGFVDQRIVFPTSADQQDADRDFFPDAIEGAVCGLQGPSPNDGTCDVGNKNYTPPAGVPPRP